MPNCCVCGNNVNDHELISIENNGESNYYCCPDCLFKSNSFESYRHKSLSSLVLNKTLFEVLAIITGFGGVFYTIFETANRALLMDTISVATALAALFIGIEHLRYVEEHDLLKRAVIFVSLITITSFTIIVWHLGFRN